MDVGERVKWFREKKGITVNKLANLAGISQSFLREIELGRKKPTVETLALVCEALGITLKDFFDDGTRFPASKRRAERRALSVDSGTAEKARGISASDESLTVF